MSKFKTEAELEAWEAEQERLAAADEDEPGPPSTSKPEAGEEDDDEEDDPPAPAKKEEPEAPEVTTAAPDATKDPTEGMTDREKGMLREIQKLRSDKRSLYDEIAALRTPAQAKPPEELERELEERFLEEPGKVLRELREQRSTEDRSAMEQASITKAFQTYGEEGFQQRYQYLDELARVDPEFKRQYVDPIVERHPDPAIALMRLADAKIAESPEYQEFIIQQQIQQGIQEGLKHLTKGQLKQVLSGEDDAPGIDGVGGRQRPAPKMSDLPYEKRRRLSEAELERAAMEDD